MTINFSPNAREHIPLTSIRGIAALWVVGCHTAVVLKTIIPSGIVKAFECGWLGVDIFFILSGFILALVYQDMTAADIPRFTWKRITRVYPLNIFLTSVVAGLALFNIPYGVIVDWRVLPYSYAMAQSFLPVPTLGWISTNWSVGVELLCYVGFPIAIMAVRKFPSVLIAMVAAGLLFIEDRVSAHQMSMWWGIGAIQRGVTGFGLGMVLASAVLRMPQSWARFSSVVEIGAALGIVLAVWSGEIHLVPAFAAILICSLYFDAGIIARALHNKVLFRLGLISYSIYLIHGVLLGRYNYNAIIWSKTLGGWQAAALWTPLFLAGTIVASELTYRFVEQPCRRLRFRFKDGGETKISGPTAV